jgi:hypothetical protein
MDPVHILFFILLVSQKNQPFFFRPYTTAIGEPLSSTEVWQLARTTLSRPTDIYATNPFLGVVVAF